MANTSIRLAVSAAVAAAASFTPVYWAHAQSNTGITTVTPITPITPITTVTIVGQLPGNASVAGFGDLSLTRAPLQASVYGTQALADSGVASIGGLTRLDASLSDAYNAEGYWSIISARGFTLDNRFNYRRDGLPINAETAIALDNKERLEVLKGTSGIQAGTSAPGGLVNLVVKRPAGSIRSARIEARQAGSVLAAADLGERFGADGAFGARMNIAAERLDPPERHTQGQRWIFALAGDWQPGPDTLLQAEIESSHQSQPSVAGFSMLGNSVPAASSIDPRINLNDQPWRQPVVMDGNTASLRLLQRLPNDWHLSVHAMQQQLKSNDRTAFPYGVYDPETYNCPQWCDRFAPDGTFTYWQYISDNERRTSSALQTSLAGKVSGAGIDHQIEAGVLFTRYRGRFQDQVFDIAGTGRIDGSLSTPPSLGGTDANTNRDERSTELFVRDVMRLAATTQVFAGLRHSALTRSSQRTSPAPDGLRATHYSQGVNAPWLAITHQLAPRTVAYASWGQGIESDVAPSRARYRNAGEVFTLKSRQIEVGVKHQDDKLDASAALFSIQRTQTSDVGSCSAAGSCTRVIDGSAEHRGVEGALGWHQGAWLWQASAMVLHAQRLGSQDAGLNGMRPVNVPATTLRLGAEYRVAAIPDLALLASLSAESNRVVLPNDQNTRIPGWSRIDLQARWRQTLGTTALLWRVGVDNATERRAWKESPYQFGHVYLYPIAPRTWRGSVQATF